MLLAVLAATLFSVTQNWPLVEPINRSSRGMNSTLPLQTMLLPYSQNGASYEFCGGNICKQRLHNSTSAVYVPRCTIRLQSSSSRISSTTVTASPVV